MPPCAPCAVDTLSCGLITTDVGVVSVTRVRGAMTGILRGGVDADDDVRRGGMYNWSPSFTTLAKFTADVSADVVGPPACRSASMARAPNDSTYTPGRCTAPTTCTATDVGGCSLTVLADAELTSTALAVVLTPARGNAVSTGGAGTRRKRTRTIVPATTATAAPTIRESPTHAIHRRDSRNHRFSLSCNSCTSAMCAA